MMKPRRLTPPNLKHFTWPDMTPLQVWRYAIEKGGMRAAYLSESWTTAYESEDEREGGSDL